MTRRTARKKTTYSLKLGGDRWDWDKVIEIVCDRIASAAISVAESVEDPWIDPNGEEHQMPTEYSIWSQLRRHEEYKELYKEARAFQAHVLLDYGLAAAKGRLSQDVLEQPDGKYLINTTAVSRDRLRLDAVRELSVKFNPNEYNLPDKKQISGTLDLVAIAEALQGDGVESLDDVRPARGDK